MFGLQMINEMDSMQREMEHLFRGLGFRPVSDETQHNSIFNVKETDDVFQVEVALPGLNTEKLEINVLGRRLTIIGEFNRPEVEDEVVWHRRERHNGSFEKTIQLSANIDPDQVDAEYREGFLRIRLPRAASALPKKIDVKTV